MSRIPSLPVVLVVTAIGLCPNAGADTLVERRELNGGMLVLEDVPPIPEAIVEDLNRYQNIRSAAVRDWSLDGRSLYVATRFADTTQLHRVAAPGGARSQLTFFDEPVGAAARQPQGSQLLLSMHAIGSEFTQLYLFDPAGADWRLLTDGTSRNTSATWDRLGTRIAFQSTRRNGAANDIWLMDPEFPEAARLVLEAPDGTSWSPVDFDADGRYLLVRNYVSVTDSRVHLLELGTGKRRMLAGGEVEPSSNLPVAFDADDGGFWLVTDRRSEFRQLAWQSLESGSRPVLVTGGIPWDVDEVAFSDDRRRAAFTVNEGGLSRLYLLDPATRRYAPVSGLPTGVVGGLRFSPDGRRLALTLNTPRTPSDVFVLEPGEGPLDHGELVRWTDSEVGGLDTARFVEPELVRYKSFDGLQVPAWVYKPTGKGPFPVVVYLHGGPESQARPVFNGTFQMWLDKLGVAVVAPNVRGSSGYGKRYLALDNGFRREDSVRDVGALLDWIAAQPDLDDERVAVYGGSYGGYMALASAVHFGARLKAAVDIVGISNFVTFLANTQDYRRDLRRVEYGDERDPAMRAHLERISPLTHADRIDVPLLVVQGQNDPRVPVTESEQIVRALRERDRPVWYINALNEGHGYRRKENRDVYQQAAVLFLRQHLH